MRIFIPLLLFLILNCLLLSGDLRVLRTKHVDVVYQEGLEEAIFDFLENVDEIYEKMVNFYEVEPDERLRVLITDETDISNAYSLPFDDFIKIYVNGDSGHISENYSDWVTFVFTHEFTHTILGNYYGPYFSVLRIFGNPFPSLLLSSFIPLYLHEGLAIFSETKFNPLNGGRMNDSKFQMFLRMDALSGNFKGLELAGGYSHHRQWAPGGIVYEYGSSFIKFIVENYGEKAILHILKEFFNAPMLGVGRAIERVTGKDMDELVEMWKKRERERAKNFLRHVGGEGIRKGERMTKDGRWSGIYDIYRGEDPFILVYLDRPFSSSGIFLISRDGKIFERFKDLGDVPLEIKVSPSGKYVAVVNFKVLNYGLNVFSTMTLVDFKTKRVLGEYERILGLGWIDDERMVVISQGRGFRNVELLNLTDGTRKLILDGRCGIFPESVVWGGDEIFFTGRLNGRTDIFELKLDGRLYRLTDDVYNEADLSYHNGILLYSRDNFGEEFSTYNIYALDLESMREYQLTNVVGGAFQPTILGDVLFYRGYTKDGYDLFTLKDPLFEPTGRKMNRVQVDVEIDPQKAEIVNSRSDEFENYIRPRIWPLFPNVYISEEEFLFSSYFLLASWDLLGKNFIYTFGGLSNSDEILNLNTVLSGGDVMKYRLSFNYTYDSKSCFKGSMSGSFGVNSTFGNALDPGDLFFGFFMDLHDFDEDLEFIIRMAKGHIRNRYFGNFWKSSLYSTFDPMDPVNSLTLGADTVFFDLGFMVSPTLSIKPTKDLSLGVLMKRPLLIIDRGTYDGMYAVNSIDAWFIPSLFIPFENLSEKKINLKLGFDLGFVLQYYLNLKLTLGIEYDGTNLKPFFTFGQDVGINFPSDWKVQGVQVVQPTGFCDSCRSQNPFSNF